MSLSPPVNISKEEAEQTERFQRGLRDGGLRDAIPRSREEVLASPSGGLWEYRGVKIAITPCACGAEWHWIAAYGDGFSPTLRQGIVDAELVVG